MEEEKQNGKKSEIDRHHTCRIHYFGCDNKIRFVYIQLRFHIVTQ